MKILLIDNGSTLLERLKVLIPGSEIVRRFDDLGNEYIDGLSLNLIGYLTHQNKTSNSYINLLLQKNYLDC
jgi:hypothetical protein